MRTMRLRTHVDLGKGKEHLLSDHHHTRIELEMMGEAIRSGRPTVFDPVALATYERTLEIMESNPEALMCAECGEGIDALDDTLCPKCKESRERS